MAKRTYTVHVEGTVLLTIDDEAVSDWDGKKILEAHTNPQRMLPGATSDLLGAMAVTVGLYGSRDGYADFNRDDISAITSDFRAVEVRG